MKRKLLSIALLVIALAGLGWGNAIPEDPMSYDPYVWFTGVAGTHSLPFTLQTYVTNPFRIAPETVTFSGTGTCQPGSCSGTGTSVWETFSNVALAMYLTNAPSGVVTDATYYLNGNVVGMTSQTGGPVWHRKASGFRFDTVELSWAQPTAYRFTFESWDATPEPGTLMLFGSALMLGAGFLRRRKA